MSSNRIPYPGGFLPGDEVTVVDGTFAGLAGRVLSPDEARDLRERYDGEACLYDFHSGHVWVAINIFGRCIPVMLEPFQIKNLDQ